MKKRRILETSTATIRTRSSAFKSDRKEERHQRHLRKNVGSRVLPVRQACVRKNKTSRVNETRASHDCEVSEKMKFTKFLHLMPNKSKNRKCKDVLPARKTPTIKLPIKAFMTWEHMERPKICRRFPETSTKEMSTLLGLLWRRMGTGQKKLFYVKANRKSPHIEIRRIVSCSDEENTDDQYLQLLTVDSPTTFPQTPGSEKLEINNNNNSTREIKLHLEVVDASLVYNINQVEKNMISGPQITGMSDSHQNTHSRHNGIQNTPEAELSCDTFDDTAVLPYSRGFQEKKEAVGCTEDNNHLYYPADLLPPFCQHNPMNVLNVAQSSYNPFYSNAAGLFISGAKPFKNTNCIPNYLPFPNIQSFNAECYSSGGVPCIIGDQVIPAFQPVSSGYHSKNNTATFDNYPIPTSTSVDSKHPTVDDTIDLSIDSAKYVYGESITSDSNISSTYSPRKHLSSGSSVSNDQFTDSSYVSSNMLSAVDYTHSSNSLMDNHGISFQNNHSADITDRDEQSCKIVNPVENKTASKDNVSPVSNSDGPSNIETCHVAGDEVSKQSDVSFGTPTSTKLARLMHMSEKDSDACKINSRMDMLSSKSAFTPVSSTLYTGNMKSLDFLDYYCDEDDYSGDDEDEFPHLVIDDSFETRPLDGVASNSGQSTNEQNRSNTAAVDNNVTDTNLNALKTNTSESLTASSLIKQSAGVSQPVQTVTYVYRKNQENVYSTAAMPNTSQTTRSQLQQLQDICRESTISADTRNGTDGATLEECPPAPEGESDFADVSTMCENILKQNCLVEPLGRSPEEKGVQTTSISENDSTELPQDTASKQPALTVSTKHTPLMISKKTYLLPRKKLHPVHTRTSNGTYLRTPVSFVNTTVTTNPGVFTWNTVPQHKSINIQQSSQSTCPTSQPTFTSTSAQLDSSQPTENKENVKIALLKDLPLIIRHCQENKLAKPKIIGPLTASAVEGMLSVSLNSNGPVQSDMLKYSVPPSKFVPGTRDTYRDTGMGNVNKNGNIKRPMNAFMVWARSYRGHLTMLYPNESNKLVSQRLGEIWKKMSMEDKQPYYREADRIKRQHRKDYPDWKYKPNTPKSRAQKIGPHDVLWARFIGASEPTEAQLASKKLRKIHPPKNPTPPPDARFSKLAIPLFGPPNGQSVSATKTTNDQAFTQPIRVEPVLKSKTFSGPGRDFCIRRLDVTQPSQILGGASCVLAGGSRYLHRVQPNASGSGSSLLRAQFAKSLSTASDITTASQEVKGLPAATLQMSAMSSGKGLGSFPTNTVGWNAIRSASMSPKYPFTNSSTITTRHDNGQSLTTKSNFMNTDGGNPVNLAPLGFSLLTNSPWNYQIFNQHSTSMASRMPSGIQSFSQQLASMAQRMPGGVQTYGQHSTSMAPRMPSGIQSFSQHLASMAQRLPGGIPTYSQHPAFMGQSMPGGTHNNMPATGAAKNLSNLYPVKETQTQDTKLLAKLFSENASQVPQDVKNGLPSQADLEKSSSHVHSIASSTSFPSSSCASPLRDAHSYVSSVLQSPSAVCSPANGDNAANPRQSQCAPFVQVPSMSDGIRLATMPVISAEAYKKLLENGNPGGGSVKANTMSFFPLQATWGKPASGNVKSESPAQ